MKSIMRKSVVASLALVSMAACIDDKYDLSDIDTTARISVDNLIIPLNLDEIKLESVIDTTDQIKVVDGVYAYVTDGTFDSDPIHVNKVSIEDQNINSATMVLSVVGQPGIGVDVSYEISSQRPSEYKYEATNVPDEIHSLSAIRANTHLSAHIDITDLAPVANAVMFENVKLQMPKNLMFDHSVPAGKYDAATGLFTLDPLRVSTSGITDVMLYFSGMNLVPADFDVKMRMLHVTGSLSIVDGDFTIKASDFKPGASFVQNAHLEVSYQVPGFDVDSFDGEIEYDVEMNDIPSVDLDDIPDFLNQEGTNLVIKNPQLYLHANNPVQQLGLYAQTGFVLTAERDGEPSKTFSINDSFFTIGKGAGTDNKEFNFCLAPELPKHPDAEYPNPQFVQFTDLSNVLAGNGLPKVLNVELENTKIPLQTVKNFALNVDYPEVHGRYKMIAPFDLGVGSHILYTDTVDGWNDEDFDKLTITNMEVSMFVTTNVPVSVRFTGYPVDANGNRIKGVEIEDAQIDANAQNQKVVIRVSGEIRHLDGLVFSAEATASGDGEPLGPNLSIKLTEVRPKVAGYYEDEF